MSAFGSWTKSNFPEGESFIYLEQPAQAALPQQYYAGQKPASRHHKKHGTVSTSSRVTIQSVDIPVNTTTWSTGKALWLSAVSALAFTCALVFHGYMFYYALETPMWLVMCWPFLLIPPIILNSIYLACIAKKVSVAPNTNILYLYVLFVIAYMSWASYAIATTIQEGMCTDTSYYSMVVAVLALTTLCCLAEWWKTISKILKYTSADLNVTMAVYEKPPTRRKLVITLRNNGKVVKEITYNMEKFLQDYYMRCNQQNTAGALMLYNNPARYGNETYRQCPMRNHGQFFAPGSSFGNPSCHYENENEKLKQEWAMKYARQSLTDGAPLKNDADQQENEKFQDQFIEEYETDNASVNGNISQNNNTA